MKQNLCSYILLFSFISLFWACGDEVENLIEVKGDTVFDTVVNAALPNARILEYKVENAPTVIYSAINDSTRTITVYLPHYYALGFIDPVISLPAGASISPDDEALVPVFGEEPFVYTVSAPGEADVQYTVLPVVQQPEIILNELSTSEDTTVIGLAGGGSSTAITIRGENFIPEMSVTKLFAIDENENAREISPVAGAEQSARSAEIRYRPPPRDEFPEGVYWLEMRAYALTARMQYPVYFKAL